VPTGETGAKDSAARICPKCGGRDPISDSEKFWPPGWSCPRCGHQVPTLDGILMFAPALADTVTGYDPKSFAVFARVESEHFWFVPRNRLLIGLIEKFFPRAQTFLEIGCGTGMVLSAVAHSRRWRRLVGSELHPTGLREAQKRLGCEAQFVQVDAREIPARNAFDVAGAFDVIEHIEEDEAVLAAMRDTVVPGGGLILAVPQHPFLWSDTDQKAHHVRRYRRGELESKVEAAGLRVRFSSSYASLLFPAMAASRLLQRSNHTSRADDRQSLSAEARVELELPPLLNSLLKFILHIEVGATLAGVRFPFGGSRMIVATKD